MTSGSRLFAEYGAYHRDRRNLICHEIGIPLIVLGIIALLRLVTFTGPNVSLNLAELAVLATSVYYLSLGREVRVAACIAVAGTIALYLVAAYLWWPYAIGAFVAGWIFQFIGHGYEGKAPAFLTNLLHLLVGPLWVASHLVPSSASSSSAR
ncbi:MAG TPA: Mpo1-like protein [Candidatus Elarobacter sp.]